ncbi:MAG TPA: hypothetical protein VI548_13475 [Chitinophagaceae bacterium]|nr:hypothetical protein [Chitinophagaceae bacterium]
MLTALTILLIRQYRLCGNRKEFFTWLTQQISLHVFSVVHIGMVFLLISVFLKP